MEFNNKAKRERRLFRLAQIIFDHWEEKSGMNTDIFQMPLIHDDFVLKGQSLAGGCYREHVVPRVYLRDECLKMFDRGAKIGEVAEALNKYLWIVKITDEEAERINSKFKMDMPKGWILGEGDPFVRLTDSGVRFADK